VKIFLFGWVEGNPFPRQENAGEKETHEEGKRDETAVFFKRGSWETAGSRGMPPKKVGSFVCYKGPFLLRRDQ